MSRPLRVVLDTNIVLSALLFRSASANHMRQTWQKGALQPLVSTDTVQELLRVLAYPKFRLSADDQEELLADYLPYTASVRVPNPPPAVPDCRDLHDLPFLELAAAGRAHLLVTGDRDLLALAGMTSIDIVMTTEFLLRAKKAPRP